MALYGRFKFRVLADADKMIQDVRSTRESECVNDGENFTSRALIVYYIFIQGYLPGRTHLCIRRILDKISAAFLLNK